MCWDGKSIGRRKGGAVLLISVRTLVIRFMSLLLMLASPPWLVPNAGSAAVLFDQPTVKAVSACPFPSLSLCLCAVLGLLKGRKGDRGMYTARKETVFRQDRYGVYEEHRDYSTHLLAYIPVGKKKNVIGTI